MLFACRAGEEVEIRGRVTLSGGPLGQELRVRASILEVDGQAKVLAETDVDEQGTYRLKLDQPYVRVILDAVNNSGGTRASALLDSTEAAPGQDVRTAPPMTLETALEAEVYTQMVRDGVEPGNVDTVDLRLRLTASRAQAVQKSGDIPGALRTLGVAVRAAQQARLRAYAKPGFEYVHKAELLSAPRQAAATLDLALDSGTSSPAKAYADFFVVWDAALSMHSALEHQKAERDAGMVFRAIAKEACIGDDCQFDPSLAEIHATGAAVHLVLQQAGASGLQPAADAAASELLSNLLESPVNPTEAWTRYRASIVDAEDSVLYRLLEDTDIERPTLWQLVQASKLNGAMLGLVMLELILKDVSSSSPEAIAQSVDRAFANHTAELTRAASPHLEAAGDRAQPALTLMLITQEAARP
ncbi:hypothetical protein D7W79_31450 [Corallococcus exercitus]|uniref:hypothetical protein n=1 Tax=Corallococcus exercitus TaxID=2316736 RepID=UPI000EA38CFA|nr:hypothetical protein [Corallococcus exercitus]RKG70808.1 hypothetical protein D7W79_31450 [Corallococcus exercitus]